MIDGPGAFAVWVDPPTPESSGSASRPRVTKGRVIVVLGAAETATAAATSVMGGLREIPPTTSS